MAYQEGQPRLATLTLTEADSGTLAALTVIAPDGAETDIAATSDGTFLIWTAVDTYEGTAGETIERWTVTGTGATTIDNTVWFNAVTDAVVSGQRVYATSADYAKLIKPTSAPTGLRTALAVASTVVDEMLLTAFYDTDDDAMPTDAEVIAAVRDATCYQVRFAKTGGDADMVGATPPAGFSLGKLSVQRGAKSGLGGGGPRGDWSPRAWSRLQQAGLTGHEPWTGR